MNLSIYISSVSVRELSYPHLQFQAEQHCEEDETEAEEADGQADQPSEQSSLPGWVVELLAARDGTAALDSLHREQGGPEGPRKQKERLQSKVPFFKLLP